MACIGYTVYSVYIVTKNKNSAVTERPRDASCHWIFCCHSRSLKVIRNDTVE